MTLVDPHDGVSRRVVLRTLAALIFAAGLACAQAPASEPTPLVPPGVTVAGLRVGGLSAEPARAHKWRAVLQTLHHALHRPL